MTEENKPYWGTCPECRKVLKLLKSGRLPKHNGMPRPPLNTGMAVFYFKGAPCYGRVSAEEKAAKAAKDGAA